MTYNEIKNILVNRWQKKFAPFFRQLFAVLEVVFYITLPTIILLLFAVIDKELKFKDALCNCYTNGEFLLYSIALLSSAYTTMKVYKNQNTSLVTMLIILASVLYTVTLKITDNLDKDALLKISIIASIISLSYTWFAMSLKSSKQKSVHERDKDASDGIQKGLKFEE